MKEPLSLVERVDSTAQISPPQPYLFVPLSCFTSLQLWGQGWGGVGGSPTIPSPFPHLSHLWIISGVTPFRALIQAASRGNWKVIIPKLALLFCSFWCIRAMKCFWLKNKCLAHPPTPPVNTHWSFIFLKTVWISLLGLFCFSPKYFTGQGCLCMLHNWLPVHSKQSSHMSQR